MKIKNAEVKCPNCPRRKLVYQPGTGYQNCTKCNFTSNYFEEDALIFLFSCDEEYGWKLNKAYSAHYGEKENIDKEWSTLPKPRAIVRWNIGRGCEIARLYITQEVKFQTGVSFDILDQLFPNGPGASYSIRSQVEILVKEWVAGISKPEGCP